MTTKMPEKWTSEHYMRVNTKSATGLVLVAQTDADAKEFTKRANDAIDQAYRAGLEAGRAEAKAARTEPAQESPALRNMTDAEKAVWGQVYAAVISSVDGDIPWFKAHEVGCERADTAVLAMRERCRNPGIAYQGQANPEIQAPLDAMVAEARVLGIDAKEFVNAVQRSLWAEPTQDAMPILEDERGLLECKVGGWRYIRADKHMRLVEAARAEGAKAERERCAGKIRQLIEASKAKRPLEPTTLEHGINVGQQDALKTALDCILNPTT